MRKSKVTKLVAQLVMLMGLCHCQVAENQLNKPEGSLENDVVIEAPVETSSLPEATVEEPVQEEVIPDQMYQNLTRIIINYAQGKKEIVSFEYDGVKRSFIVYVPHQARPLAPVVYMLHGTSGNGEKFYNISGWVEKANQTGLIAVFPSALSYCIIEDDDFNGSFDSYEIKITTKWNDGKYDEGRRKLCSDEEIATYVPSFRQKQIESIELKDDVLFLDQTREYLKNYHDIDSNRIYISGFSNGAGMSAKLSVDRSNVYAAFATHGGGAITSTATPTKPANLIMTVGSLDDRFLERTGDQPYKDENDLLELPLNNSLIDVEPLATAMFLNATTHSLSTEIYYVQLDLINGKKVFTYGFDESLVGAENLMTYSVLEDVAHFYPNGDSRSPISMTDYLWPKFRDISL